MRARARRHEKMCAREQATNEKHMENGGEEEGVPAPSRLHVANPREKADAQVWCVLPPNLLQVTVLYVCMYTGYTNILLFFFASDEITQYTNASTGALSIDCIVLYCIHQTADQSLLLKLIVIVMRE